MANFDEWDFASAFTPEQAILLMEGKYPGFSTGEYGHLYQERVSSVMFDRMREDYNDTVDKYRWTFDGPVELSRSENKLPSLMLNIMMKNCFEHGRKLDFEKWLESNKSEFSLQKFTREDIQYWLYSCKLPTKYQFLKKAEPIAVGVNDENTKLVTSRWPWGDHHTELLGHLDAAAQRFWARYDPSDISTAPKSDEVIAWLVGRQTSNGSHISKSIATSMATILRVDGLRTGQR